MRGNERKSIYQRCLKTQTGDVPSELNIKLTAAKTIIKTDVYCFKKLYINLCTMILFSVACPTKLNSDLQ